MAGWEDMWSRNGGLKPGQAFDASEPLPFITTLFEKNLVPKGSGIIPGCGRGYAVSAFAREGRSILGMDISETAVKEAQHYLNNRPQCKGIQFSIEQGSFFDISCDKTFDFAYDYTFLCAIQPNQRVAWAEKYAEILKSKGHLMTVVFPIGTFSSGPPFALSVGLVEDLLRPHGFQKIFEQPLGEREGHPGREGKTTFCI